MSASDQGAGDSSEPRIRVGRTSAISLAAQVSEAAFNFALIVVVARYLGASQELDMALLALVVPTALGNLIETLAYLSLLPFLAAERVRAGLGGQWLLANRALNTVLLALVGLAAVYCGLLPAITSMLAGGYSAPLLKATISLGWMAAPFMLFRGLGGVLAAFLMTSGAVVAAFARHGVRSCTRLVAFLLLYRAGWGAAAFVAAAVIGDIVGLVPTGWAVRRITAGLGFRARALLAGGTVRSILGQAGNQGVIGAMNSAVLVIERSLASGLAAGSVAILNYGRGLGALPLMLGRSIEGGLYPRFSQEAAAGEASLGATVWRGLRALVFVVLPVTAALLVVRGPLVILFYRRGEFTEQDASLVTSVLVFYLVDSLFLSMSILGQRTLYASMQSGLAARREAVSLTVYVIAALVLRSLLGIHGLALAVAIRSVVSSSLLLGAVRSRQLLAPRRPMVYALQTLLAGAIAALGAQAGWWAARGVAGGPGWMAAAVQVFGGIAGAGIAYLAVALITNREELRHVVAVFKP